ncbi:MAG: hypothetical protein HY879_15000 [Deltaproteobacteria bacterium]|nr:hypothetical protein [Deltaproteobacteria bacterium]
MSEEIVGLLSHIGRKTKRNLLISGLILGLSIIPSIILSQQSKEDIKFSESTGKISPQAASYSITQAINPAQYRFYHKGKHFMSLIYEGGIYDFRPHPSVDEPDAWGSSWYFQPFLPGAVLKDTTVSNVNADSSGINVTASGKVSSSANPSGYGNWNSIISFSFSPSEQKISGAGSFTISLVGLLAGKGDLNLFKIASNRLENVPLLGDGYGNTGDMKRVDIIYKDKRYVVWDPLQTPGFFPSETTDSLSIDVVGEFNHVDLKRMGYSFGINPIQKPSLKVIISSNNPGVPMIFGGFFDTTKKQDFTADNVGVTPLILQSSQSKHYSFNITFESTPKEKTTAAIFSILYLLLAP